MASTIPDFLPEKVEGNPTVTYEVVHLLDNGEESIVHEGLSEEEADRKVLQYSAEFAVFSRQANVE